MKINWHDPKTSGHVCWSIGKFRSSIGHLGSLSILRFLGSLFIFRFVCFIKALYAIIIFIPIITNPLLLCLDGQPDWVGDISLLRYAKQLVWSELRGLGFSLKEELERGWWSHIICIISAVEGRWSENINCLGKSWPGDCVQVRVESIVEICVWLPDFLQHLHVEAQLVDHKVVRVLLQPLQALSDFQPLSDLLSI